jgi:hypothetical protein
VKTWKKFVIAGIALVPVIVWLGLGPIGKNADNWREVKPYELTTHGTRIGFVHVPETKGLVLFFEGGMDDEGNKGSVWSVYGELRDTGDLTEMADVAWHHGCEAVVLTNGKPLAISDDYAAALVKEWKEQNSRDVPGP